MKDTYATGPCFFFPHVLKFSFEGFSWGLELLLGSTFIIFINLNNHMLLLIISFQVPTCKCLKIFIMAEVFYFAQLYFSPIPR